MTDMKFYYGRLNFSNQYVPDQNGTAVGGQTKAKQSIYNYIDTDYTVFDGDGYEWKFGAKDPMTASGLSGQDYIAAQFGKIFEDERTEYSAGEFTSATTTEEDSDVSWFVYHPETNLIIFNQRNRIGYDQFREAFTAGYNSWVESEAGMSNSLTMEWVTATDELSRIINNMRVTKAKFEIRTNDSNVSGRYGHIEDAMTDSNSGRMHITYTEASDRGIDCSEEAFESLVDLVLTNDSFDVKIEYIDEDGDEETFNTKTSPASKSVPRPNHLAQVTSVVDSLVERGRELV
jgi:hypothetical protein